MDDGVNRKADGATRRAVLVGLAVAATLPALPAGAAATPGAMPPNFLAVSSTLCGIELDKSYIQLAGRLWDALTACGASPALLTEICELAATDTDEAKLLGRIDDPRYRTAITDLVAAWYTGMVPVPGTADEGGAAMPACRPAGPATSAAPSQVTPCSPVLAPKSVVVTYNEALAWIACDHFTKPPATCGGPFGYWHHHPSV